MLRGHRDTHLPARHGRGKGEDGGAGCSVHPRVLPGGQPQGRELRLCNDGKNYTVVPSQPDLLSIELCSWQTPENEDICRKIGLCQLSANLEGAGLASTGSVVLTCKVPTELISRGGYPQSYLRVHLQRRT